MTSDVMPKALQVGCLQTRMFGESGEHARTNLFAIMKGENEVTQAFAGQRLVGSSLALDLPAKFH